MASNDDTELWISRERDVPPDPSLARYIGAHHSLQSAVADIVDNSVSVGATRIRIRFILTGGLATALQIIDDGPGMSAAELDEAMVMGGRRAYRDDELGHFGVGFKAASLSQADTLLIFTRKDGSTPAGRKMRHSSEHGGNPRVSDYETAPVIAHLDSISLEDPLTHGTVIEWNDVRSFPQDPDAQAQNSWLDATVRNLVAGLGARHHRIIGAGSPAIMVDVFDADFGELGSEFPVTPLNPFDYTNDPTNEYPKVFHGSLPEGPLTFTAHVIPYTDRTNPNYLLGRGGEDERQGFFIYRRDRLLQVGGWNSVLVPAEELRFARIQIDIDTFESRARINPEKSGVEFDSTLRNALINARADDSTLFRDFQTAAKNQDTASRSRSRRPLDFVPAIGIPSKVRRNLEERGHLREDAEAFLIRWGRVSGRRFFAVDRDAQELIINIRFQQLLAGERMTDEKSGPLTRTMMYLLTADFFSGQYLGAAQKMRMEAMQEALWLAAEAEEARRRGRRANS